MRTVWEGNNKLFSVGEVEGAELLIENNLKEAISHRVQTTAI